MRPILILFTILFLNSSHAQQYANITSDWCKMGLKGKVKEIQYTYSHPKLFNQSKYTTSRAGITFSTDGYITKQYDIKKNGKHRQIRQYTYFSETEKAKGYFIKYGHKRQDSVVNTAITDTSFYECNYFFDLKYGAPETYTFNNKQQLIGLESANKKYNSYRIVYDYNSDGYLIKEATAPPPEYSFVYHYRTYTIQATDKNDNPTIIIIKNFDGDDKLYNTYRKEITYTYYD